MNTIRECINLLLTYDIAGKITVQRETVGDGTSPVAALEYDGTAFGQRCWKQVPFHIPVDEQTLLEAYRCLADAVRRDNDRSDPITAARLEAIRTMDVAVAQEHDADDSKARLDHEASIRRAAELGMHRPCGAPAIKDVADE